jgi:hypothetical protein
MGCLWVRSGRCCVVYRIGTACDGLHLSQGLSLLFQMCKCCWAGTQCMVVLHVVCMEAFEA